MSIATKKSEAAEESKRHVKAAKLSERTGGLFEVTFQPDSFIRGDDGATGHQFSADFAFEDAHKDGFATNMWLDDREPDMEKQLVKELRRVSRFYENMAKKVQRKLRRKGGAA